MNESKSRFDHVVSKCTQPASRAFEIIRESVSAFPEDFLERFDMDAEFRRVVNKLSTMLYPSK